MEYVKDAKVTDLGDPSDHSAILIKVSFKRKRLKSKKSSTTVDWNLFLEDDTKDKFNAHLKDSLNNHVFMNESRDMSYESFSSLLMSSAKKVGSSNKTPSSGWYNFSIDLLKPYYDKRTEVLNYTRQANISTEEAKKLCIESRKNLKDAIIIAKSRWTKVLADRIHQMSCSPRDSWKAVNTLKNWIHGHHISPEIMRFRKENGEFTKTNKENVAELVKHFLKVFNSKVNIDWTLLDELKQKSIKEELGTPLSLKEFTSAIMKLTLHKSPGLNGISPNVLRALDSDNTKNCLIFVISSLTMKLVFKIGK